MAYPKKARQENPNIDTTLEVPDIVTPAVETPAVPQVAGGAPRLNPQAAMAQAWGMTGGTSDMLNRVITRATTGTDSGVAKQPIRNLFKNVQTTAGKPPVTPPALPLKEAQNYLKQLATEVKSTLDQQYRQTPPQERAASPFWRAYEQYPEQMATVVARRVWTNHVVASGPVAQWLNWLER